MNIQKINGEQFALFAELFAARRIMRDAKKREDDARNAIKLAFGEEDCAFSFAGKLVATQSVCERKGIDTPLFKANHSELYESLLTSTQFVKITEA